MILVALLFSRGGQDPPTMLVAAFLLDLWVGLAYMQFSAPDESRTLIGRRGCYRAISQLRRSSRG
jgi:hypothetical protein